MPFKEGLLKGKDLSKKKARYGVQNWSDYNRSLKARGSLTLWLSPDIAKVWYIQKPFVQKRGHPFEYSDEAITTILTLRLILKQRLRQIEGFVRSVFSLLNLDLRVPDYTRLSRRGSCPLLTRRLEDLREPGHIVIDSTGLKVFGESEWLETKHGKQYCRKLWRKLHIGVNEAGYFISRVMTNHVTDDRFCMDAHLQQVGPGMITELIADTGYDGASVYQKLEAQGIKAVIPPPRGSPLKEDPTARNKVIEYIDKKGRYAWQTKNGYGRRNKVENSIYRYKEIIGRKLYTRKWNNQDAETHLGCHVINQFTKLGMPVSIKIA